MKVFKFGGASVKDPKGVKNVAAILQTYAGEPILVVISAMGKTTNALEKILSLNNSAGDYKAELENLQNYHYTIIDALFPKNHEVYHKIGKIFDSVEVEMMKKGPADQIYDQVVSLGEILSTVIVHQYLVLQNIDATWSDARDYIVTDNTFREGKVDWAKTCTNILTLAPAVKQKKIVITQGFLGRTPDGLTTTLGRDGSDFTAGIFASCFNAESVTIWKDVPGVMNADPKRLPAAMVFEELPFREAAEMTYYGASVIHPKTIKPLANKRIPLYVKNFDDPSLPGTKIHECHIDALPPLIVFKDNQCLISCKVTDYTFVSEDQMSTIFNTLSELNIRINVMQNSAISFSFCIDFRESKVNALIEKLHKHFEVYYNTGLTLITIKNYDKPTFDHYHNLPGVLLEQSSRSTLQILLKTGPTS